MAYIAYQDFVITDFDRYVLSVMFLSFLDFVSAGIFVDKLKLGRSATVLLQYLQLSKVIIVGCMLCLASSEIHPLLINSSFPIIYFIDRQIGSLKYYIALRLLLLLIMFIPQATILVYMLQVLLLFIFSSRNRIALQRNKLKLIFILIFSRGISYLNQLPLVFFILSNPLGEIVFVIYRAYTFVSAQIILFFTRFVLMKRHFLLLCLFVLALCVGAIFDISLTFLLILNFFAQIASSPLFRKFRCLGTLTIANSISGVFVALISFTAHYLNESDFYIIAEGVNFLVKVIFLLVIIIARAFALRRKYDQRALSN